MKFWRGRKVLLTGHTGFKGSWLSLILQMLGADVVGVALPPATNPNLFELANIQSGMISKIANLADFDPLLAIFHQYQPEVVIHMAAQALVRYSYQAPVETYTSNVLGSVHLLEAARQTPSVKAIVMVTTDKCYENREWTWGYRENDTLGGHDPYSNSKACVELITDGYRRSYFAAANVGLASARAGNVIGGGDWASDRLIPDIMRMVQNNLEVNIRNPNARRPWQHVLEPLGAYLLLAEKLYYKPMLFNQAWNFGPEYQDVKTVRWIVDYMLHYMATNWPNSTTTWNDTTSDKTLHEATNLMLDCSKAKELLGWQPKWNLTTGLQETLRWYQGFFTGKDIRDQTMAQIKNFFIESVATEIIS